MCGKTFIPIAMIVLIIGFCAEVQAVTDFRIAGISGRIAFVQVEAPVGNTVSFGGSVNLGNINTNTYLLVDVLYWKCYKTLYSYYGERDMSDLATKINIKYEIPCDKIVPYVGAGLTIHKQIWTQNRYGFNWDETKLGFQVFAGADCFVWKDVYCFTELAFDRSDRDQILIGGGLGFRIK